jgi:hypothetical protein
MITKIYTQLHRETIEVAPEIDWSASIEQDISVSELAVPSHQGETADYLKGELTQ